MQLTVKSRPNFLATALPFVLASTFSYVDLPIGSLTNSVQAQQHLTNEIRWYEDLAPAIQYASTNNLPLMLHFYGDNCPPCRLLERKAFKDSHLIGKLNSSVVAVRINAEKQTDLRTRYNITRWPQDVFVTANGQELHRSVSPQDPAVYGKLIDRIALRHRDASIIDASAMAAKERRFTNQTSSQISHNQPANPMTLASTGSYPVKTVSPVAHSKNAPASQTISFDHLSAPAVTYNEEAAALPTPNGLPIINVASTGKSANTATMTNPFVQSPATSAVATAPMTNTSETMVSTPQPPLGMPGMDGVQGMEQNSVMQESMAVPMHMTSSPTSMRSVSASAVHPNDIAATPSNPPSIEHNKEATVGLDGYCPVTLFMAVKGEIDQSNCWTQGSPKFAVKHRGRIYMCATEDMRQRFLKGPDIYSPCLSGFDLIHYIKTQELIDGKCEFGCFQGDTGRIFLFASQENSDEFRQKEAFYSRLVNTNQPERVATQPDLTPVR